MKQLNRLLSELWGYLDEASKECSYPVAYKVIVVGTLLFSLYVLTKVYG